MGGRLQVEEETRTEWMAPGRVGSMSLRGVYHCGLAGGAPALPSADRGEGGGGEWTDAQVLVAGVYGGDGGEEDRFAGTNGGVPKEDSEGGGCGGGGVILRKGGGGVPLSLLRSLARRSENFGEGGGVDRMKGATCGVGVVKVLVGPMQFVKNVGLSFGLKDSLTFHFEFATCLKSPFRKKS